MKINTLFNTALLSTLMKHSFVLSLITASMSIFSGSIETPFYCESLSRTENKNTLWLKAGVWLNFKRELELVIVEDHIVGEDFYKRPKLFRPKEVKILSKTLLQRTVVIKQATAKYTHYHDDLKSIQFTRSNLPVHKFDEPSLKGHKKAILFSQPSNQGQAKNLFEITGMLCYDEKTTLSWD